MTDANGEQTWRGCVFPADLHYDLESDVWVRMEVGEHGPAAVVGMTDVAQARGGRLVHIGWKKRGSRVVRGRPLAVIESAKWVGPMRSPLTGEIVETNEVAFDLDVAQANRDPYGAGWFYRLHPSRLESEFPLLSDGARAFAHYRALVEAQGLTCIRCTE